MQPLEFGKDQFVARADRTLFHQETQTLFLSDLHLGKGAHFRQSGIPVPDDSESNDLDRLIDAVNYTKSNTVWILGDLFHHPRSITHTQMDRWIVKFQKLHTTLKVILGNHDRDAQPLAKKLGFAIYPEPTNWHGIELAHHPDNRSGYRIAGHVHPQVELKAATDHLSCSCFAIQNQRLLLLPAFTKFSGGPRLTPGDALCFPIIGDQVLPPPN
ncbi:MAG: hypothetical protein CMD99_04395 [Gammaproteobacteria bacterium]|nr:hypothetical protein [Gammaproteobacteria bacterium]|tara:strand:+ start:670 stop:1311 length:642 start_codon:yes stop_codon:yes gene_type:complete